MKADLLTMGYPGISQLGTWPLHTDDRGNFCTKPSDSFQNFERRKIVDTKGPIICHESNVNNGPDSDKYLNQQTDAQYDQMPKRKCVKGCSRISGE
jgi:hypothetical protein